MSDFPLVSICIPNYNGAKYIEKCIDSALSQTYKNIEIIVVDDGSIDNSLEVISQYTNKIKIYKNDKNLGQIDNTYKAIELSSGKFCTVLHSDDFLLDTFVEILLPQLLTNSNVGMSVGERYDTDENENIQAAMPLYNEECIIPGEKQAKVFLMTSFFHCQVLFRKELFLSIDKIDKRFIVNFDGLMWFCLALVGDVAYTQNIVGCYRMHSENTTSAYNKSIDHIIEYYGTLKEKFHRAKGIAYLESFFDDAINNLGRLTVRYAGDILIDNAEIKLVNKYLYLANALNDDVCNMDIYKYLKLSISMENPKETYIKLRGKGLKRNFRYDPPDGYIKL